MALYSVVIPCYKSSLTIKRVVDETVDEFKRLGIEDFEFVLVNDCSPDDGATKSAIFSLAETYRFVKAVDLGKNTGQHNALLTGLRFADGEFIISMDDDMQTRPSEIIRLIDKINEGYDVVYGYFEKKQESLFRRLGSLVHHATVTFLMRKPKELKTSSFWIIRRYVRDYAVQYTFPQVAMQGIFLRITENIACTPLQHFDREVGTSGYTFKKLLRQYSGDLGFSVRLLNIVFVVSLILLCGSVLGALIILAIKLFGSTDTGSWGLSCLITFYTGLILLFLGIIGNYLGRLYTGETGTPQAVIRETRNIEKKDNDNPVDNKLLNRD